MKLSDLKALHLDIVKTSFDLEVVNEKAKTSLNDLITLSEQFYHNQVDEVCADIIDGKKKIILIAGPSSSGKTTTSHLIKKALEENNKKTVVISLDDFFIDRAKTPKLPDGNYDYENVTALDIEYFNICIKNLLNEGKCSLPTYNFITGKREKKLRDTYMDENTVVIIEGLHALNPVMIKDNNASIYRIYVCLNSNFDVGKSLVIPAQSLRLMRRLIRDVYNRGHSISHTFEMWTNVLDGENKYIKPFKSTADYLIDTTHMYEPLLYANYLSPLLEQTEEAEARNLQLKLYRLEKVDKCYIPDDSLLWEFISK